VKVLRIANFEPHSFSLMMRLRVSDVRLRRVDTEDAARGSGGNDGGSQCSRPRSDIRDGIAVENARELHQKRSELAAPSAHESFVRITEREHRGGRLLRDARVREWLRVFATPC
jgi:hypothetical protein